MKEKIIIETIGTIEKKELLSTIGYPQLVLESSEPFPGYHGTTVPDTTKPNSLFLITRSKYTSEKVIRVIQKVKRDHDLTFDATPGLVTLYNMLNPCIRFKDIETYDAFPPIIHAFEKEGIEFMTHRKVEPYQGIIKVRKYFLLEVVDEVSFNDLEEKAMHYFVIPIQLRWPQFEKLTLDLKRNIEDPNFDAALGVLFRKNGLVDMIRIYDEKSTPEKISYIRTKYLEGISKLNK